MAATWRSPEIKCLTEIASAMPRNDTSNIEARRLVMDKYICQVCGYVYDPAVGDSGNGVQPGTSFEDLPEDWVCPECGVGKDQFEKLDE